VSGTKVETFATAKDLNDRLDAMNDAGITPEMAALDHHGVAFLAVLYDLGDEAPMDFISTDSEGRARSGQACEECGTESSDWTPTFPVSILVTAQSGPDQ